MERPKVGIGVQVYKDGKLLLGKRKGTGFGDGFYSTPGGHLENGETFEQCARREVREEAGIEIKNIKIISLANLFSSKAHYVDIGIHADWKSGTPTVLEPEKCEGWDWYDLRKLPRPLIEGDKMYLNAIRTGKWYAGTKSVK